MSKVVPTSPAGLYEVKKIDGLWKVVCKSSRRVQFSSLRRKNCTDWVVTNS